MKFARFMATPVGRAIRIIAGLALIAIGILLLWPWGLILSAVGAVVAFAGIANVCFVAPFLRVPFRASRLPSA